MICLLNAFYFYFTVAYGAAVQAATLNEQSANEMSGWRKQLYFSLKVILLCILFMGIFACLVFILAKYQLECSLKISAAWAIFAFCCCLLGLFIAHQVCRKHRRLIILIIIFL